MGFPSHSISKGLLKFRAVGKSGEVSTQYAAFGGFDGLSATIC